MDIMPSHYRAIVLKDNVAGCPAGRGNADGGPPALKSSFETRKRAPQDEACSAGDAQTARHANLSQIAVLV